MATGKPHAGLIRRDVLCMEKARSPRQWPGHGRAALSEPGTLEEGALSLHPCLAEGLQNQRDSCGGRDEWVCGETLSPFLPPVALGRGIGTSLRGEGFPCSVSDQSERAHVN